MRYDGRPLWEQKKDNKAEIDQEKGLKFWTKRTHESASAPSPLYVWHQHHAKLRAEGKLNEHDTGEIRAALNGTINQWTNIVKGNAQFFNDFIGHISNRSSKNDQLIEECWKVIIEFKKKLPVRVVTSPINVNKYLKKLGTGV